MIRLTRLEEKHGGTWGILTIANTNTLLFTCELQWHDNARNKSCIPAGMYRIEKITDYKWIVCDVQGRSGILLHPANYPSELRGCIALGLRLGKIDGRHGVLDSRKAFDEFNKALNGITETTITIKDFEIPYQMD